jgi:hypothetical protein
MGWIWFAAPLAVAGLGIILFLTGAGHMLRGRALRGTSGLGVGAAATLGGLAAGLLGLNIQTYSRLSYESPVAEVSVRAVNPAQKRYDVTVHRLDDTNLVTHCELQGDEWLLSGRVQKWKPWANVIGLNATYTLDQVENKYFSAAEANGKPITACDISGPPPQIDQYLPASWVKWLVDRAYVQDRRFGSANYMPLADGASYKVVITQMGFNAEPSNDAAHTANEARP